MEDRWNKVKTWLKNPYNVLLVSILALALIIRLYFFVKTGQQPLWYDEADYMSTAKHWAFDIPYRLNVHRPPLFQFIAAIGFMIGFGELTLKFLLAIVPSVALVYFVFLLGREMYDERIGLIAAFLTAISWTLLFWTVRYQPDFISMSFQVLSIFFMWRYWKSEKTKPIVFAGIFAALGFLFKVSALLVPITFMVFILIKDRFSAFKNKNYYWFSLAFLLTLLPYFIWSQVTFGTPFSFASGYAEAVLVEVGFAWHVLNFFYMLSENILFVLFIIGTLMAFKFVLYLDVLAKNKKKCFDANIFGILILVIVAAFYIFYIKAIEDRWVFLWLPFMFMFIGNASMFIYDSIKKYTKILAVIALIVILAWGAYAQFGHASDIIEAKKDSYAPVKQAALWMKDNSLPDDKLVTVSYPQTVFYSEREVVWLSFINSSEDFDKFVDEERPKFVMLSVFEPHKQWMYDWPDTRNDTFPVHVQYGDPQNTQPMLIVYRIAYDLR